MAFPYMSAANRINIPREGGVEDQATLKAAPVREFMKETFLQQKKMEGSTTGALQDLLVTRWFKPSQLQGIMSRLRGAFVKRYIVEKDQ